ncbi:ribosomal protein L6 [Punctularia strigosozonata HHB-11173 SS5]|uniref:ribosomal protein L6 n=1 Tax=Punctularia strigosozonata (strain HHB-11173) TaxID=741275 RepID=UPI00044165DC|nr:ribosomal protein L6 [Punctularia strigosozonata HHB-11173 SS5]EIN12602.1 ribosomal protein L6 [Punctularia strigosozonata HHB-11173 SS5]
MLPRTHRQAVQAAHRAFSSSAPRGPPFQSNIGKKPIPLPPSITLTRLPDENVLAVSGPNGTARVPCEPFVRLTQPEAQGGHPKVLEVRVDDPSVKQQRTMWGTTRSLIANAVTGMSEGFSVPLYLVGVGYRAALEEDPRGTSEGGSGIRLNMKVGFSHSVYVPIPPHIKAEVPMPTKIVLSCTDKQKLGLFAAEVKKWRPPEPYKGKGIFLGNETIRIRAIKKK